MVVVIVFTGALLALGTALLSYAVSEKLIARYHVRDVRLNYITESGVEAALALLQRDYYYSGELSGELSGGVYSVSFLDGPGQRRDIVSRGTLEGFTRRSTVTVDYCLETESLEVVHRHKPVPQH